MKKNSLSRLIIFFPVVAFCMLYHCGTYSAGGSEIGNPRTTVAGIVADSTGAGVASATLYLTDPLTSLPDSFVAAHTGPDGCYEITGLPTGNYNLSAIAPDGNTMFLRNITTTDQPSENGDTTLYLGTDTLLPPVTILVSVERCADTSAFIFIPGTIFRTRIDSCGEYALRCPAMIASVNLLSGDSIQALTPVRNFGAGESYDFTARAVSVPTPTLSSGIVTGTAGRDYTFIANEVTIDPPQPVDYRFDWGETVSLWNSSPERTHAWNTAGTYAVRVQARSAQDTLILSTWSDTVTVTIR